jgi:hypothetical protein
MAGKDFGSNYNIPVERKKEICMEIFTSLKLRA